MLCVGMLMIVLDVTIVNVALPSIQDDLRFSTSSLAWVVNAYLIAFGGLLLLAGRLGDLIGRRRIFLAGIGLFTTASLACGLADSQSLLIAARFVQGIGGAMTSAVILGMIVTMFPEPREQAKAIGVYAFVASAGGSVGLLAGGVITQSIDWHWIFFVNIPIGIATAVFAARLLEHDPGIGFGEGADVPGAVLITAALMLGVYTIVKPAADYGWGAGRTLALGGVSLALLLGFLAREATRAQPAGAAADLPLAQRRLAPTSSRCCRSPACSACSSSARCTCAGCSATTRCRSGSRSCPSSLTMGTMSIRYSERLVTRFGARNMLVPGLRADHARPRPVRAGARPRQLRGPRDALDAAARHRRRRVLSRADERRDVRRRARRTPASPPGWSTRPPRSAERSGWRCSRRSPHRAVGI